MTIYKEAVTRDRFFQFRKRIFFFFFFFFFFPKLDNVFLPNKNKCGKKKNCSRPTGHYYGHPLDRKQTIFYEQPNRKCLATPNCRVLINHQFLSISEEFCFLHYHIHVAFIYFSMIKSQIILYFLISDPIQLRVMVKFRWSGYWTNHSSKYRIYKGKMHTHICLILNKYFS